MSATGLGLQSKKVISAVTGFLSALASAATVYTSWPAIKSTFADAPNDKAGMFIDNPVSLVFWPLFLIVISGVSIVYYIRYSKSIINISAESGPGGSLPFENSIPFFENWYIDEIHTELDFADDHIDLVNVTQRIKLLCKKGGDKYFMRISPSVSKEHIHVDGGIIISQEDNDKISHYTILLNSPLLAGGTTELVVMYQLNGAFPLQREFWHTHKYYDGRSIKISIKLRDSRPLKGFSVFVVMENDVIRKRIFEGVIYEYSEKGRPTLMFSSDAMQINHKLRAEWNW